MRRTSAGIITLAGLPKATSTQVMVQVWCQHKMGFVPVAVGTTQGMERLALSETIPDE